MEYITNKLEQAIFINKNGCSDLNCNTCKFIDGVCRIYKPDTSPKIKTKVTIYLRNEKLKNLESGKDRINK